VAIPEYNFWPDFALEECDARNEEYAVKWPEYVRALPEPIDSQLVSYVGLDGTPRTFRALDLLTQLHSHSVHHRAQIMLSMRSAGLETVNTDYLLYCILHP
jgi:uncharacterized damage-inducible protein DinB